MNRSTLSVSQVDEYTRLGFTVASGVLGADEIAELNTILDTLADQQPATTPRGFIFQVHAQTDLADVLARDRRVVDRVSQLIQPGLGIHSSKVVSKDPGLDQVCHWHQDEAFYTEPDHPEMDSEVRASIWIPLQNVDETNGCLRVVPGSHRWGLEDFQDEHTGHCGRRMLRWQEADEMAVAVPMTAGDCLFFSAYLWHSSEANESDQPRRAFIVSYQEATVTDNAYHEPAEILIDAHGVAMSSYAS